MASISSREEAHYCVFRSALKDIVYAGARLHLKACSYNFIVLEAQGNQNAVNACPAPHDHLPRAPLQGQNVGNAARTT